ncbi:MAG: preprotein translocase subunit SecE [Pseudomonadota bacterium]
MAEKKQTRTGPVTFMRQVRDEGSKVTWTTRPETVTATIMVLIMSTIVATFLFFGDQIIAYLVRLVTGV